MAASFHKPSAVFANRAAWITVLVIGSSAAAVLLAWTAMLALDDQARRWEPTRLRLRLLADAGRIVRGGRRVRLVFPPDGLGHRDHHRPSTACTPSHPG